MEKATHRLLRPLLLAAVTLLVTATFAEPPAPAKPPERLSAETFAAGAFIGDPKLSPAGDRVIAKLSVNGELLLGIKDFRDPTGKIIALPFESFDVRWYRWASNNRVLIGLGRNGGRFYSTRLFLYDLAKRTGRYLGPKRQGIVGDDVLFVADDGSYLLLAMAKNTNSFPGVIRVDLDSESAEMVEIVNPQQWIYDWYADANGIVRLGLGYAGLRRTKVVYRNSATEKFKEVARVKWDDSDGEIDTIRIPTSTEKGYVVTNTRTGRFGVYEFDWKTLEIGAAVFEHPTVDVDDFQLSEDGKSIAGVFFTDDRQRVKWFSPEAEGLQKEIDLQFPDRSNWVSSSSKDRLKHLVWSGAADNPGAFYYYDRPSRVMTRIAAQFPALENRTLAPMKAITYRARDGLEVPGYLTLPPGRPAKGLPLVLLPHGGPHARDEWGYDAYVQFLANRGYAVLQPNFRGSSGYGRDHLAKGYGQWGLQMQDDLSDGVRWLVAEGTVDPKRVCIMGSSYGGYAAMMGAITTPDLYRCAISFAGVSDVNGWLKAHRGDVLPKRYKRWRQKVQGEVEVDLKAVSPLYRASEVAVPLLLVHGTDDQNVPFSQAELMAAALKKANRNYQFVPMKGVGHGFDKAVDQAIYLKAVEEFLATYNPADLTPTGVQPEPTVASGPVPDYSL